MYNLPSEQKEKSKKAIIELKKEKQFSIYEPCDCSPGRIMHNNGGNYHDEIYLRIDEGLFFVKHDTTSELEPPAKWEEITEKKAYEIIEKYADCL